MVKVFILNFILDLLDILNVVFDLREEFVKRGLFVFFYF